ncbi:MAG: hypothetical protein WCW35_14645 [Bacteroidota bacterium]
MIEKIRPLEPEGPKQIPRKEVEIPKVEKVVVPDAVKMVESSVGILSIIGLWIRENLINDILLSRNGGVMQSKLWYTSKTLWVNLICLLWMFIGPMIGIPTLDTETMAAILGVINVILRIVTKGPVTLS